MNYANMIEEKNLKKTFIVATLCSTLVGTFTSSMGLWDRVKEKRKQRHRDTGQDDEIKQLKARVEASEKRAAQRDNNGGRDEVADSFERSGALISREFDQGYEQLGRRFAVGDVVTENRLQAQVIALQQTVINVLQDALYHGRQLDRVDMAKLVAASNAARDGSLDALRQQRERQMLAIEAPLSLPPPPPPPATSAPSQRSSISPPSRASTMIEAPPLFCRYSLDLQYIKNKPLTASFAPGGDCRCPACGVRLGVASNEYWAIGKRARRWIDDGRREREVDEDLEFHLGQRFLVKCHTPDGEFACILCNRHREKDAICSTVDVLIDHVGKAHDVSELEQEPDFEVRSRPPMLALPPA